MNKIYVPKMSESFGKTPQALVSHYLWLNNGYRPRVAVFLAYDGGGLYVEFGVDEPPAQTRYNGDGQAVYKDSAVEMFLRPFAADARYVNFEFNRAGFLLMGFGESRDGRAELSGVYKSRLNVRAYASQTDWRLSFEIPFDVLSGLYGKEFRPKDGAAANFYKCGDETPTPHYGAVFKVRGKTPDFHLSRYFGDLVFLDS
ncbi:MAG: hypothetical protein LBP26_04565 [Clostridiales bacterium]|jgi:hypothetical protein|nr:hypothetical protein [Clostridiales bacterium]